MTAADPTLDGILAMLEARRNYWLRACESTPVARNARICRHEISRAIVAICQAYDRPVPDWWGGPTDTAAMPGFRQDNPKDPPCP